MSELENEKKSQATITEALNEAVPDGACFYSSEARQWFNKRKCDGKPSHAVRGFYKKENPKPTDSPDFLLCRGHAKWWNTYRFQGFNPYPPARKMPKIKKI